MTRPKGAKNKLTIEREILATRSLLEAGFAPVLGKEALTESLAWFVRRAREAAGAFLELPVPPPEAKVKNRAYKAALAEVDQAMIRMASIAEALAPYQSPKLAMTAVQHIDPFAHMSDQELLEDLRDKARRLGLVEQRKLSTKKD